MVTFRTRGREDADRSSGRPRHRRPAKSSKSPLRAPPGTRRRSTVPRPKKSGLSDGVNVEDDEQNHDSESHKRGYKKSARVIVRKSVRLLCFPGGGRRSGPRRSTRPTKPTSRYQASNMFDSISSRSVLTGMNKKSQLNTNKDGKIDSKALRSRTAASPRMELSDSEDDDGLYQE